ncbi:MAG: hypothetical protein FWC93_03410 [Defluviitaleaceae bacterium]|nr:hypothetical protein [Defluviitaleaceae bacterium]
MIQSNFAVAVEATKRFQGIQNMLLKSDLPTAMTRQGLMYQVQAIVNSSLHQTMIENSLWKYTIDSPTLKMVASFKEQADYRNKFIEPISVRYQNYSASIASLQKAMLSLKRPIFSDIGRLTPVLNAAISLINFNDYIFDGDDNGNLTVDSEALVVEEVGKEAKEFSLQVTDYTISLEQRIGRLERKQTNKNYVAVLLVVLQFLTTPVRNRAGEAFFEYSGLNAFYKQSGVLELVDVATRRLLNRAPSEVRENITDCCDIGQSTYLELDEKGD